MLVIRGRLTFRSPRQQDYAILHIFSKCAQHIPLLVNTVVHLSFDIVVSWLLIENATLLYGSLPRISRETGSETLEVSKAKTKMSQFMFKSPYNQAQSLRSYTVAK